MFLIYLQFYGPLSVVTFTSLIFVYLNKKMDVKYDKIGSQVIE